MGFDISETAEAKAQQETNDGPPSFGDSLSSQAFRGACEEYAEWCVENIDTFDEVDLSNVTVEVSKKLKRAAGKAGEKRSGPTKYFMRFAFGAYEKWGWGIEIRRTIRHELIHIKQYETGNRGGHGIDFKRMAEEVDAPRHCKQFTDYNYGIYCSECDERVAGKYRECKMTKNPERYQSQCCKAVCYSEKL